MLREVHRVFPHIVGQAVQSTPGARVISVHIYSYDELGEVWMEFSNEFVEAAFHGNYARLLRQQAGERSSYEPEDRSRSDGA